LKPNECHAATDLREHFFTERVITTWNHREAITLIEAGTINTLKSQLQRLYDSVWTLFVLLTPEAEPVPVGRPHPASYPVTYTCIPRVRDAECARCC